MERLYHERETQAAELIEKANENYKQRDQAQVDMVSIENLNNQEHQEFEEIIYQYDKEDEKIAYEEDHKYDIKKKPLLKIDQSMELDIYNLEEKRDETRENISEKVKVYEEAFEKLRTATGIESIDELIKIYGLHEEQNFSLFNFVSSQTGEIDVIQEQITELQNNEEELNEAGGSSTNQV